jgi:hypothetical protein
MEQQASAKEGFQSHEGLRTGCERENVKGTAPNPEITHLTEDTCLG